MKKTTYSKLLDDVTNDQIPVGLDLAPQILMRIQKGKGKMKNTRMKTLIPTTVFLIVMVIVTYTVPVVAATFQRWIGIIPGFGLVHDVKIRTLAEPVSIVQDGVTLKVEEVTASSDKTTVKYTLAGVQDSMLISPIVCFGKESEPMVRLPGGGKLNIQGEATAPGENTYHMEAFFSSIPADVLDVTFSLTCTWQKDGVQTPWSWDIPLKLTTDAKAALTVVPVIEITPSQQATTADASEPQNQLEIKQIVPLADGYILSGTMSVEPVNGLTLNEDDGYLEDLTVLDANKNQLRIDRAPNEYAPGVEVMEPGKINWQLEVFGENIAWPMTITVNSVSAITDPYAPSSFTVDVGENPQPDDVWQLDKDVALGQKTVHVISLKRLKLGPDFDGYELSYVYAPDVDFSFQIDGCFSMGGGGGSQGDGEPGDISTRARPCNEKVPSGRLNIILTGHGVEKIQGPWKVTVAKPVAP